MQSTLAADEAIVYYYWLDTFTLLIAIIDQERVIPVIRLLPPEQQARLKDFAAYGSRWGLEPYAAPCRITAKLSCQLRHCG